MKKERFSHDIDIAGILFTVHGDIDRDGLADIDEVTVQDSIVNLWPALRHYAQDDFQVACDDYLSRQRQVEASWGYQEEAA